jgi:hypothetical protein
VIEAQVKGTTIPEAVPVEGVVPKADALGGATTGPEDPISPEIMEEVHDDTLPNSSIVVRSPEIQDAEPIRSAPMSEIAATSRGGLELLADDLIYPAMVARKLELMHRAEQWMKDVVERSQQKSDMLRGYGDTVLRAETLEKELNKARNTPPCCNPSWMELSPSTTMKYIKCRRKATT